MALLEGVLALYTTFILYIVLRSPYSQKLATAFVIPLLAVIVLAMFYPRTPANVFVWTFLFPILTYTLLGRKSGFMVTLGCGLLSLAAYLSKTGSLGKGTTPLIISEVVICFGVIWVIAHLHERFREKSVEAFHRMATTDELTGLQNRRQMQSAFNHLAAAAERAQGFLAVVVHVARLLRNTLRQNDWVFRIGGKEFSNLLLTADQCMYMAKQNGRTQVVDCGRLKSGQIRRDHTSSHVPAETALQ